MSARRPTVLVTGACGLIGSHLVDALLDGGCKVTGLDDLTYGNLDHVRHRLKDPRFDFIRTDILDLKLPARLRPDWIIHEAALKKPSEDQPGLRMLEVNGWGTHSILEYARRSGSKVILGSTSDVYGRQPRLPFGEEAESVIGSPRAKRWGYAVSKMYAEQLTMAFWKERRVPAVVVRYFGVFSERSARGWSGGHVPLFIDAILNGRTVTIHGDGSQTRSMGHVDDVVRGTILAMRRPAAIGQVINLGNDEEVSVLESAKIIHEESGVGAPLKLRFIPVKKVHGTYEEIVRRVPDLRLARKLLGYRPLVPFREAVRRVLRACKAKGKL